MKESDIPDRYRALYRSAMTGKNKRAAVRCFCLMCVGWQRVEVDLCTAPTCPLFNYREWSKGASIATEIGRHFRPGPDARREQRAREEIDPEEYPQEG